MVKFIKIIKLYLFFFTTALYFQHTFKHYHFKFINLLFSQLDDILLIILVLILPFLYKNRIIRYKHTKFTFFILGFFLISFISFIFNQTPLLNYVLTLKIYLVIYIIYFFILFLNINYIQTINLFRFYLKYLTAIFTFEIFIQILQILIDLFQDKLSPDSGFGTFSGANNLGYTALIPAVFWLIRLKEEKNFLYCLKNLIVFVLVMILSMAEYAILMFSVFFIILYYKDILKHLIISFYKFKVISLIFVSFLIIFLGFTQFAPPFKRNIGDKKVSILSMDYLIFKLTVSELKIWSGSARLVWYPLTYERLNQYAYSPLIGMGPGMYASYTAFKLMPEPNKSIYNIFGQLELGLDAGVDSQIIPIWGEFGYLGISFVLIFLLYVSYQYYKNYRFAKTELVKSLNRTMFFNTLYIILGLYVNHFLETQTIMGTYFVYAAFSEKLYRLEKYSIKKGRL